MARTAIVLIQLAMVGILIAFPGLVTGAADKKATVDMKAVSEQMLKNLDAQEGAGNSNWADNPFGGSSDAAPSETPGETAPGNNDAAPGSSTEAPAGNSGYGSNPFADRPASNATPSESASPATADSAADALNKALEDAAKQSK